MLVRSTKQNQVILSCIIILGLTVRIGLVNFVTPHPERYIQADANKYNQLAINLVSGHGYSTNTTAPFVPENFRVPGYPFSIALIYGLFDYKPSIVLWIQILIGGLTILLAYIIAEQICGQKAGLISASLLAISPHTITYTALLWSDTEYTLIFIFSIILTIIMFTTLKLKWVIFSALVSGIAVMIHPRSLYLPILFAIILSGTMLVKREHFKKILIYVGVYLIVFNLVLLPWRVRNYISFGIPNITSAAGINMLGYGAALTEAANTGEDQWLIVERLNAEVEELSSRPLNEAEFWDLAFRFGLRKIMQDPITYTKVHTIGMAKIFLPGTSQITLLLTGQTHLDTATIYSLFTTGWNLQDNRIAQNLSKLPLMVWGYIGFEILYLIFLYSFSVFAIIRMGRSHPWLWLLIIVLLYLTMVAGPAGAPRFRVVMMPLMCTLASCGIVNIRFLSRKMDLQGKPELKYTKSQ